MPFHSFISNINVNIHALQCSIIVFWNIRVKGHREVIRCQQLPLVDHSSEFKTIIKFILSFHLPMLG